MPALGLSFASAEELKQSLVIALNGSFVMAMFNA